MSSVFAAGLFEIANNIRMFAGPWPSDHALNQIFTLEHAARALILHDHPKPTPSLKIRAKKAFRKKFKKVKK